jgi:hypothetical protein
MVGLTELYKMTFLKIKKWWFKEKIVEGHQFAKQEENILGQRK